MREYTNNFVYLKIVQIPDLLIGTFLVGWLNQIFEIYTLLIFAQFKYASKVSCPGIIDGNLLNFSALKS